MFEKLKVPQAMSSAIVDQTAAILAIHFSKFINDLHVKAFPLALVQGANSNASSRRRTQCNRHWPINSEASSTDAALNSLSQHTQPARTPGVSTP